MVGNVSGLCVVALSRNLKLTTTLDRAITQNPCYDQYGLFTMNSNRTTKHNFLKMWVGKIKT